MRNAAADNIDAYVNDIERYALIDRAEERRLARLVREGGPGAMAARDSLVCANLRLVVKIAHTFKQYDLPLADLVAEGNIGLVRAAEKFDPDNGAKFSVYAAWWIKQAMRVAVAERTRTVRIPRNSGMRIIRLRKARARWIAEHGAEPSDGDLARLTGIGERAVASLLSAPDGSVSMNAHTDADDSSSPTYETALSDELEDGRRETEERRKLLASAMAGLSDLERELVGGSYLSAGRADLRGLALRCGVSPADAARRLEGALASLRRALSSPDADACAAPV